MAIPATGLRARGILKALKRRYPRRGAQPEGALTDHLAAAVIGREAAGDGAYAACDKLLTEFVDWNEVRVARGGEVERVIGPVVGEQCSGQTARRLLHCLQQVFLSRGDVDLDGLARTSRDEARKFLQDLDFLDIDEVNLIILLGLGEPVMPVDSDVLRTGKRLGVISHTATKLQAQRALEQSLEGEDLHACYVALREHGRRVCFTDSPECAKCPVSRQCRQRKLQ